MKYTTMSFTNNLAIELRLPQRLILSECHTAAYHLRKAVPHQAAHLNSEFIHAPDQFFRTCSDLGLTIDQVANAIDQTGKKTIADELRSKNKFDANKVVRLVEKDVLTDNEFAIYCDTLGLGPDIYLQLMHDRVARVYLALRRWENMKTRTLQEFIDCMNKWNPALASKLEGKSVPSNNWKNSVVDMLTPDAKTSETSLLAELFDETTKIETIRSFVCGPRNGYLMDICMAMDKKKEWKQFLKNLGLYTDKRIVDMSIKLETEYNNTRAETTLPLLQEIAKGKFGEKSLDEFEVELLKLDSPMVKEAVKDWVNSRMEKEVLKLKVNETFVESHSEISKFLSSNDLASDSAIPEVARLLADFGATDLSSLKELKSSDFEDAGLSRVKARKAEKLLADLKN